MKLKEKALGTLGAIRSQKSFAEDKENQAPRKNFNLLEQSKAISKKSKSKDVSSTRKPLVNITNVISSVEEGNKDSEKTIENSQKINSIQESKIESLSQEIKNLQQTLIEESPDVKSKVSLEEEQMGNKKIVNFVILLTKFLLFLEIKMN